MKNAAKKSTNLKLLQNLTKKAKTAYILIYSNPDPDGLASAWALKEILSDFGVSAEIGYTGEVGRLQNASMIQSLRLPAAPFNQELFENAELLATVDCHPGFFKEMTLPKVDIVIDHHPGRIDKDIPFVDHRPKVLSTASILTEYFVSLGKPISKRLATALYYGVETDSRGQQKGLSATDSEAFRVLEKIADHNLLRRIEFSQYSLNDLDYFSIALIKLRYSRNVLYAHIGAVPYTDVCVQVADFLMRVKEANWALVTGVVKNKLIIVFRCDGHKKHAGTLAQKAFGEIGSAGGHQTMGRAEIFKKSLPPEVTLTQNEKLQWFVIGALAKVDAAFRPLQRKMKKEGLGQEMFKETIKN